MDRFAKLHKSKPAKFHDLNKMRQEASLQLHRRRKENRTEIFNSRRNIPEVFAKNEANDQTVNTCLDRKLALKKYQRDREFHKNKASKKPPFVVGIPHHGSSPVLKNIPNNEADTFNHTLKNETVPFQPPRILSTKKLTSPHTPTVLKRSVQKTKEASKPSHKIKCNLYLGQNKFAKGKKASNYSDEVLAMPLSSVQNVKREEHSTDHGKGGMKSSDAPEGFETPNGSQSYPIDYSSDDVDLKESKPESGENNNAVLSTCGSIPNYEKIPDTFGAEFQRSRLEHEHSRLNGLAQKWEAILQLSVNLPSDTVDEIDSVVGQTRLLINGKFKLFHKLIEDYENKTGSEIITPDDLNGFWDMMYLQVTNLNMRYNDLDKLQNNKWLKQSQATKKKIGRPKLALQNEESSSTSDFIKEICFESAALPTNQVRTPLRKSLRIQGKTPTPKNSSRCIVRQSLLNTNHNCVKEAKSNRSVESSQKETTQVPLKPSSCFSDVKLEQKITKSKTKSSLYPSNLVVKDNITDSIKSDNSITPLRRSERKRTKVLDKLDGGKPETGVIEVDACLQPGRLQRSGKKQTTRSVIFNSNVVEKTSKKRPPTPFIKRRCRKSESPDDSS